jgi:mono/diheme cytochrome c family protein
MSRSLLPCVTALALLAAAAGLLLPGATDEDHGAAPAADLPPHARAPHGVPLTVADGARLLAWVKDIELVAGREPGRFSKDGDTWVDSHGVYTWDDEEEIYWQQVGADVLTRGRRDFVQFCSSCHGLEGDGYGRSARGLRPPPRSFLQSTFKFTKVPGEFLPNDGALVKLVQHGLDGTPMLPWAVSEERLRDIVQYVKSLSPEDSGWRDPTNEIGVEIHTPDDPWQGKEQAAVAAGRQLYHKHQCWQCHPAYATQAQLNELRGVDPGTAYDASLTYGKLKKDSSYQVQGYHVAIPAPDFTWHTLRYGRDVREVFQTIAAGIGGAGMPTWGRTAPDEKGAVPDEEIWAIAHYVRSLVDAYKDKPAERAAFMAGVRSGK